MPSIAIIGAGLSGVSLSLLLDDRFNATIIEKSSRPGGRISTKIKNPYEFDHGTQYFKVKSPDFKKFLVPLFEKNLIKPWTFKFANISNVNHYNYNFVKYEDKYYVGVPSMNSFIRQLANKCNVIFNKTVYSLKKVENKWSIRDKYKNKIGIFDWVIISTPVEQACKLLPHNHFFNSIVNSFKMKSLYTLMVGMKKPINLKFDAASVKNCDVSWIAVNSKKPSRNGNFSMVINSSYEYAKWNLQTYKNKVMTHLENVTNKIIKKDLTKANFKMLHKWNYVECETYPKSDFFLDKYNKIGLCGDWCVNSRVEGAFMSAKKLSTELNNLIV